MVLRRNSSNKKVACCAKDDCPLNGVRTYETETHTEENLSQTSTDQSTDDSMDSDDIDKPTHRPVEQFSSDGSFLPQDTGTSAAVNTQDTSSSAEVDMQDTNTTDATVKVDVDYSYLLHCQHTNRFDDIMQVCDSVRELIQRRTSSDYVSTRSSIISRCRGVTFLDEELGLTPRHIVTDVYYRPHTSMKEKRKLYYCSKDFIMFEKEYMYEKIEAEIQAIERQKRREQDEHSDVGSLEDEEADKEPLDRLEVEKLVRRVRTRFNLERV